MKEDVKRVPYTKLSPMERINELEQSLERAKEGLAREIAARDEFQKRWEDARSNGILLAEAKRKIDSLEDSYRALTMEYHKASSANAVLRDVLDRILPKTEKVES